MRNGRHSYAQRPQGEARRRDKEKADRALRIRQGLRHRVGSPFRPAGHCGKMAADIPRVRERGAAAHGREAGQVHIRAEVAAASAVIDGGMAKPAAMAEFGIMSRAPLDRWCRLYREGGAEALRPKPKGRPKGPRPWPPCATRGTPSGTCRRAPGLSDPPTTTRSGARPGPRGRSCGIRRETARTGTAHTGASSAARSRTC